MKREANSAGEDICDPAIVRKRNRYRRPQRARWRQRQRRRGPPTSRFSYPHLLFAFHDVYITAVRVRPDYGDKRKRNKRTGPGGGTRRLHRSASRGSQKSKFGRQKKQFLVSDFRFPVSGRSPPAGAKQDRRTCKG